MVIRSERALEYVMVGVSKRPTQTIWRGKEIEYLQEKETWRRRSNFELYQSHTESDIVNFIKIQRNKWAGHVVRMDEDRTTKKVFNAQPIGTRRKGRPNHSWIDGPEKKSSFENKNLENTSRKNAGKEKAS
ncbi:uncharacterized protein TNCV_2466631 [Trichonephila clavipes]|nr:uncharacterized protein TNCV_2466631 [Trichonephila clavipes]